MTWRITRAVAVGCFLVSALSQLRADETATVTSASRVLDEFVTAASGGIPQRMLASAQGLVVIPQMIKGGFIVGVRHGRGVMVVRDAAGNWQPPLLVSMTGGSVGWQAGIQSADVVLVFTTRRSVESLKRGKFTIGADAAVAAGPIGRQAAAGTDSELKSEIYSYSRARGLFLGVSLDGSAIEIDPWANSNFYQGARVGLGGELIGPSIVIPPAATQLLDKVALYTGGRTVVAPPGLEPPGVAAPVAPSNSATDIAKLREQLVEASARLQALLDENWKTYLALPAEIYSGTGTPSPESLRGVVEHYETVARNPQYQTLTQRAEFRAVFELLQQYAVKATQPPGALPLPPPPVTGQQTVPKRRY